MPRVVSFHYHLTDKQGQTVDSSKGREPLTFMEGSGQIIPGLENEVLKLKTGDKKRVTVLAPDAYGVREESMVIKIERQKLPAPEVKIGDRFRGGPEQDSPVFVVTGISGEEVILDGNHPLAGQDLTFDVEVTEVRDATAEELEHGHAHGAGGHEHSH